MKGAMRAVMPDLRPDRRDQRGGDPLRAGFVPEETEIQENPEDDRVDRRGDRGLKLAPDLLGIDRQIIDRPLANLPLVPACEIPEQPHCVRKRRDHEENDDLRYDHRTPRRRSISRIACAFTNRFTYPLRLRSLVSLSPCLVRSIIIG